MSSEINPFSFLQSVKQSNEDKNLIMANDEVRLYLEKIKAGLAAGELAQHHIATLRNILETYRLQFQSQGLGPLIDEIIILTKTKL